MGNLQNNGGNSAPSLNVPPNNLFEAIARASKESARLRALQEGSNKVSPFDSDDDYDSDVDDGEEGNLEQNRKKGFSGPIEPPDPKQPWLISPKQELESERAQIQAVKEKCKSTYPGTSSTYIEKIKWAEATSRTFQTCDCTGRVLREVIHEKSPNDILIQVLIRKRSLQYILTSNEGMAKVFLSMFTEEHDLINNLKADKNETKSCKSKDVEEQDTSKIVKTPHFLLRPNAPESIRDTTIKANERLANYIDWIMNQEDSGTVLSPKQSINRNEKPSKESNSNKPDKSRTRSALTCFFNILAKKNSLLSTDIIQPISSIIKLIPGCRIIDIGPSRLPPQFVTTLLHVEGDTEVGCLPHFPSPNNYSVHDDSLKTIKTEEMCAAIEIMVYPPPNDVRLWLPPTKRKESCEGTAGSAQHNDVNDSGVPKDPQNFEEKNNHDQLESIHHKDRLYAELIQLKKKHTEKTFYVVNAKEIMNDANTILPLSFRQNSSLPDDQFPVIWMPSYFDVCFPRIHAHYNHGRGECTRIRSKIVARPQSLNGGNDYCDYKFELLESNLNVIIGNRCHLSPADQFCSILALTMVIALDSSSWKSQPLEANEMFDSFGELFDDLGTFWKTILKNHDEDIGLGLPKDCNKIGDSGSRKALLQLLSCMQSMIQDAYGHLLGHKQVIDFGLGGNLINKNGSPLSNLGTEKKRNWEEIK